VSPDTFAVRRTGASTAAWIPSVRVVTYNIHSCVGVDRRYDPRRISTVLREIDADIACLQEVDARRSERHADQWAYLGIATGCQVVTGTGVCQPRLRFGNAILSRFPVLAARLIDLTVAGHEPRCAIDADLLIDERVLRVIATHFGLHAAERRQQASQLMAALGEPVPANRRKAHAVLLMGDLNEWRGRRGAIRSLDRSLGPAVLSDVAVYRSPLARIASDHLPLVGRLCWSTGDLRKRELLRVSRSRGRLQSGKSGNIPAPLRAH
jgi:endonuclease/exonuclease/phosphatase family metal-dependent hydrolase